MLPQLKYQSPVSRSTGDTSRERCSPCASDCPRLNHTGSVCGAQSCTLHRAGVWRGVDPPPQTRNWFTRHPRETEEPLQARSPPGLHNMSQRGSQTHCGLVMGRCKETTLSYERKRKMERNERGKRREKKN